MKVLLVSEPGVDGVFRYVEALSHYLVAHDVLVHLAYSDRRGSDRLEHLVKFIHAQRGTTLNLATANRPAWSDLRALSGLFRFIRRIEPDVIHSHSSKAGALARMLPAIGHRVRHVYQPHAYAGMQPHAKISRLPYNLVERWLGTRGLTINCSTDERNFAHHRLRLRLSRLVVIPNGIDTDRFSPPTADRKNALRQKLGLPVAASILGSLARTAPQKDPMTLYRAFAGALQREPNLFLYHIGHGELDASVQNFVRAQGIEHRILRQDYLSTPIDFYHAIDGFILTSIYEGMSLAALEAMACDLPLILSDAPGNRDFARLPLTHLWMAPVGDASAFANAIVKWRGSLSCDRLEPSNHRPLAIEQFDNRRSFGRVLSLYRKMSARQV